MRRTSAYAKTCALLFTRASSMAFNDLTALAGDAPLPGSGAGSAPVFEPIPCALPGVTEEHLGRFRCGTVLVPRIHGQPDSGTFRLHVTVLRSLTQPAAPDPIVLHPGGPGAAGSNTAGGMLPNVPKDFTRDIVLIDDRGAGKSEPRICLGTERAFGEAVAADLTLTEYMTAATRTLLDCRREMTANGIPPEAFGTTVTVEDMELIRRALGIERWNLHGSSYGTRIGMSYMARHPESLRSAVLESVMRPPQTPMQMHAGFEAAFSAVVRECEADAACAKAHPHLSKTLQEALQRLERSPLIIPINPTFQIPGNRLILNRVDFDWMLFTGLYERAAYAHIPAILEAVRDGRTEALVPLVEMHASRWDTRFVSLLTLAAVMCRDTHATTRAPITAGYQWLEMSEVCPQWSAPGPVPETPRDTRVPTLILSGENDPVTPPEYAGQAARVLGPNARWVRFPGMGHGVAAQSACGLQVLLSFFDDPRRELDTKCVAEPPPIRFE